MHIVNIAGYKFIVLDNLHLLRELFLQQCQSLGLKGTILLSKEGVNINLSGKQNAIDSFKRYLQSDARFNDMRFHESRSASFIYKRLKVKIKKEIISFRQSNIKPQDKRAQTITPNCLKQWLDEKHDFILLDTRNEFETRFGTFESATQLSIDHFSQFPAVISDFPNDKPIVLFCTGGIRCEKAALYMTEQGYSQVYQLEGGILNYFVTIGKTHYQGTCFVFDERVSVDNHLNISSVNVQYQCTN